MSLAVGLPGILDDGVLISQTLKFRTQHRFAFSCRSSVTMTVLLSGRDNRHDDVHYVGQTQIPEI